MIVKKSMLWDDGWLINATTNDIVGLAEALEKLLSIPGGQCVEHGMWYRLLSEISVALTEEGIR